MEEKKKEKAPERNPDVVFGAATSKWEAGVFDHGISRRIATEKKEKDDTKKPK